MYILVSFSRGLLFLYDQVQTDLFSVLEFSFNALQYADASLISTTFNSITGRLYGANTIVLGDQFQLTSFWDMIR